MTHILNLPQEQTDKALEPYIICHTPAINGDLVQQPLPTQPLTVTYAIRDKRGEPTRVRLRGSIRITTPALPGKVLTLFILDTLFAVQIPKPLSGLDAGSD